MVRAAALTMGLSVFASAAFAQPAPTPDTTALTAYLLCARRAAVRLEPSGEPAEEIAEATTWVCATERLAAYNAELRTPTGVTVDETAKWAARGQAVAARLCRKTGDCALNHVTAPSPLKP